MKKIIPLMICLFLICNIAVLNSCKKEEPPKTTGGLLIKAKLSTSSGYLSGVMIGLATSKSNLDNSVYLQDKTTNGSGEADFGQLNPGNYYYDGYTEIGSTEYYGEGQIQITAGQDQILTLVIQP